MSKKDVRERAVELFALGMPSAEVAKTLNNEGHTTPRGLKFRSWTASYLYRQATKEKKQAPATVRTIVVRNDDNIDRRIFHTLLNQTDLPDSTKIRLLNAYLDMK